MINSQSKSESFDFYKWNFVIKRSNRKSLGIYIERDGGLSVRAPQDTSLEEIEQFVQQKSNWLHDKLGEKERLERSAISPRKFINGEGFLFLGQSYRLRLVKGIKDETGQKRVALRLYENWFELKEDQVEKGRCHFIEWYKQQGTEWIMPHLQYYAARLGIPQPELRIRELKYRWGSCSRKTNTVNLNWKIFMAPPTVIFYVLVHELVHFRESKHGKEFWELVERVLPDYRDKKQWLDANGAGLEI